MTNMIRAELYRTCRHTAFYAAFAVLLFMIVMSIYTVSPGTIGIHVSSSYGSTEMEDLGISYDELSSMGMSEMRELMKEQTGYQLDRDILSVNVNLYYVFLFIAAVVIAVDFTAGCAKNTLSSAIGRGRYFLSKLCATYLICLALFLANTYITYFANLVFNGENLASGLWEVTEITLLQLPAFIMIVSIPVGIAFMVKKTAVYNLIAIPFLMILQLVFGYGELLLHIPQKVMNYTPDAIFSHLANNPSREYILISYTVCAAVSAVFLAAGYLVFQKSEIK